MTYITPLYLIQKLLLVTDNNKLVHIMSIDLVQKLNEIYYSVARFSTEIQ